MEYQYERCYIHTVCPKNIDLFYVVTYYLKWVTTSWTHSIWYLLKYHLIRVGRGGGGYYPIRSEFRGRY